ncbi:unnamed protein product, partial [Rangifer tarandus platyrhynchus]
MLGPFGAVCRASAEPEQLRRGSWTPLRSPRPLLASAAGFQAAAGAAATYCLSPRPRCGAAPARPAGDPGRRT